MRKDWKEITANKTAFIESLQNTLLLDENSNLDCLAYEVSIKTQDEYVYVLFNGGGCKKILATGNSNYANAKASLEAVYG